MKIEAKSSNHRGMLHVSCGIALLAAALACGGAHASAGKSTTVLHGDGECEPAWAPISGGVPNSFVYALEVFDDGAGPALYAGGWFNAAGGVRADHVARWDGTAWSPLSTWMSIYALAVYDDGSGDGPALFAGGGGNIAQWRGNGWSDVGGGIHNDLAGGFSVAWVYALAVFDDGGGPALYAGGSFTGAGDVRVNNIAKWDGQRWSALGSGVGDELNHVNALTVFDDGDGPALYVGGSFSSAGGITANGIAKWDGQQWSALGSGVSNAVDSLTTFDDGSGDALYAGGNFTTAGGVPANRIAKWDGSSWAPLGSGMNSSVFALTVFDDGGGPALYAGGAFTTAGGMTVNRIAKWDGSWSPLGAGEMSFHVRALTAFDVGSGGGPALYVGGQFPVSPAGDTYLAQWQGCTTEPPCGMGDLNCDGVVDVSDLLILLAHWGPCPGGTPSPPCQADINGDGFVDVGDLLILLANWG